MDLEKYEKSKNYIHNLGFDIDVESYPKLKEVIQDCSNKNDLNGLEYWFKQLQNCGGYALQIPACVFSGNNYTFEEQVLRIQELYPFTRLLADTELKENEYIVKYRAGETGHHFIRIDDKGIATEKNECNLPEKFNGWRKTLEDKPEAVFAVVKQEYRDEETKKLPQCNRDMYLDEDAYYKVEEDGYVDIIKKEAQKPKTFTELLKENYINQNQSFKYNNKTFNFKINKDEPDIIYICDDTQVLGQFYSDGADFDIELNEEKKNYIYGFQPTNPLSIVKCKEKHENEDLEK